MRFKLAIYDWNGTLFNDIEASHACTIYALEQLAPHNAKITLEEFREEMGVLKFAEAYHRRGVPVDIPLEKIFEIWCSHYDESCLPCALHEDVINLLEFCEAHGAINAVVSAATQDTLKHLDRFGLIKFFPRITFMAKEKDKALRETLAYFGIKPEEAFYLDDTYDGVSQAKNVGVITFGFTKGYNSAERIQNAHPDFLVNSHKEVLDILSSI